MGIGASIFLIALGAILAFAVNVHLGGLDVNVIGWILMLAGVLGLITFALVWGRRRTVVTSAPVEDRRYVAEEPPAQYRRVEERRVDPPL